MLDDMYDLFRSMYRRSHLVEVRARREAVDRLSALSGLPTEGVNLPPSGHQIFGLPLFIDDSLPPYTVRLITYSETVDYVLTDDPATLRREAIQRRGRPVMSPAGWAPGDALHESWHDVVRAEDHVTPLSPVVYDVTEDHVTPLDPVEAIDDALAALKCVQCGKRLGRRCPSESFCSESCQLKWQRQGVNPTDLYEVEMEISHDPPRPEQAPEVWPAGDTRDVYPAYPGRTLREDMARLRTEMQAARERLDASMARVRLDAGHLHAARVDADPVETPAEVGWVDMGLLR